MPVSEKKRRSNDAYNAKCDVIQIRPIKPVGAAIRAAAQAAGRACRATSWRPAPTACAGRASPWRSTPPTTWTRSRDKSPIRA